MARIVIPAKKHPPTIIPVTLTAKGRELLSL